MRFNEDKARIKKNVYHGPQQPLILYKGFAIAMQMERWNPWWRGDPDHTYLSWSKLKVRWVPDELQQISLEPLSLNFVSGPRQVGKTTIPKLLISSLLNQHVDPKAVLYISCDEFSSFKEVGETPG